MLLCYCFGAAGVSLWATPTQRPPRICHTLIECTGDGAFWPPHT